MEYIFAIQRSYLRDSAKTNHRILALVVERSWPRGLLHRNSHLLSCNVCWSH